MTLLESGRLFDSFIVGEGDGLVEVVEAITGNIQVELTTSEVSQVVFTVRDPNLDLLRSGRLSLGSPVTYRDLKMEVAAVETGGTAVETVQVTARPRSVQRLRGERGVEVVTNSSSSDYVIAAARRVGLEVVAEPSAVREHVTRTQDTTTNAQPPSTWDVIGDLAAQLGFIYFEASGVLYFARPSWLLTRDGVKTHVVRHPRAVESGELSPQTVPSCRRTADSSPPVEISVALDFDDGAAIRPGDALRLIGVPTFDDTYLVTSVPLELGAPLVTVSAATPVDPEPRPAEKELLEELFHIETPSDVQALLDEDWALDQVPGETTLRPHAGSVWTWPAVGTVTSRWGAARPGGRRHAGIDIAGPVGRHIHAARDGVVTRRAVAGGYGNLLEITHNATTIGASSWSRGVTVNPGFMTRYAHLSGYAVRMGDRVSRGQVVAFMGNTGVSSGPHLHFEIHKNGSAQDPERYLPDIGVGRNR